MTGSAFRDYIVRTFKRTDKDTEIYEAITDTVLDIKLRVDYDTYKAEAYSTSIDSAGDYKIGIPSDFQRLVGEMRCIEDSTNTNVLIKLSKYEFDRMYPNPNASDVTTAMPIHYCLFGEFFLFGNVPDKTTYTYEFSYSTEEVETVTSGTTTVPFSTRYRECLKFGALSRLYSDLGNDNEAMKWNAKYENEIIKLEDREVNNNRSKNNVEYNDC